MIIKKGTIITCPKCWKELMVIARDILDGEEMTMDWFEGLSQLPEPKAALVSDCCMEPYFNIQNWRGKLHTNLGWLG